MRTLIERSIPDDDFVMAMVAAQIVANLRVTDPDLLTGWLDELAESCMVSALRGYERAVRGKNRHGALDFSEAASRFETGDTTNRFTERYVVDSLNTWKSLGEMTGSDHRFVADRYRDRAASNGLLAKFHEAVAKKVGSQKTSEVFSVATYTELEGSIVKQ